MTGKGQGWRRQGEWRIESGQAAEQAGGTRGVGGKVRMQGRGGMSRTRRRFKAIFVAQWVKNPLAMWETWV